VADDIVIHLRREADDVVENWDLMAQAADEIEQLRAAGDALSAEMTLLIDEYSRLQALYVGGIRIDPDYMRAVKAWSEARRG
jgi:hypothetical protein